MTQVSKSVGNPKKALVCAGCNVTSVWGSPAETLRRSQEELAARLSQPVETSRFYETPAFPEGSGPNFVNAAFSFHTAASPVEVLDLLHQVEALALRERSARWAPRTLDLDLIGVGGGIFPDLETWEKWAELPLEEQQKTAPDQLILPHPRVQDRAFALLPLLDIAPDWIHPVFDQSIAELCGALEIADKQAVHPLD